MIEAVLLSKQNYNLCAQISRSVYTSGTAVEIILETLCNLIVSSGGNFAFVNSLCIGVQFVYPRSIDITLLC